MAHESLTAFSIVRMNRCALLLLAAFWVAGAKAATYYVATTGDDGCSCATARNSNTPRQTPTAGMRCLSAGDVLVIAPGTYGTSTTIHYIKHNTSGTGWDNPITVRGSDPSNRPVLRTHLTTWDSAPDNLANSHYWVFQDLIVDAGNNYPYGYNAIGVADGIKLVNVWGRNATHSNITSWIDDAPRGRYFINVEASGASSGSNGACTIGGPHDEGSQGICHGMYISGPNIVIDGGSFHDQVSGNGIHPYSAAGSQSIVIKNATFYNNSVDGIGLVNGSGTHQILNNVFYSNGNGLTVYSAGNANIYNNTFYGNGQGMFLQGSSGQIINNIFYNTGNMADIGGGGSWTQDHNLCNSTGSGCDLAGNPLFVNADDGDFRLQSGSPAIDKGITLSEVPTDIAGIKRPQGSAYDIGAYEYVSESTGIRVGSPRRLQTHTPAGPAKICVFDVQGKRIRGLSNRALGGAILRLDGRDGSGNHLPNGMYLLSIKVDNGVYQCKVILSR